MPSLHGEIAMLVALWTIVRLRSAWRRTVLAYPLVMAFALVYYAEHYVIDIAAGWVLAGAVMLGVAWWVRRHGVAVGLLRPNRRDARAVRFPQMPKGCCSSP